LTDRFFGDFRKVATILTDYTIILPEKIMENPVLKQTNTGYQLTIGDRALCNLISIPGGSFLRKDGQTVKVNGFCMAQFPVTQEFYEAVTGANPSSFKGSHHPVESVSWYEAVRFCGRLNEELMNSAQLKGSDMCKLVNLTDEQLNSYKINPTSKGFRLPTEAEWEYAAHPTGFENPSDVGFQNPSDVTQRYAGSDILDLVGWYDGNNEYESKPVGLKFPNQVGLYDMSGNVWEWCWDWSGEYNNDQVDNPIGENSGAYRVIRGGSWILSAGNCRSARRFNYFPDNSGNDFGFRLLFVP